jgi:hypothetical protein
VDRRTAETVGVRFTSRRSDAVGPPTRAPTPSRFIMVRCHGGRPRGATSYRTRPGNRVRRTDRCSAGHSSATPSRVRFGNCVTKSNAAGDRSSSSR